MANAPYTYVRAGDTEPMTFTVSATGLTNLDNLVEALLYARVEGETTNQIDGAACSVADSTLMQLEFDPLANGPGSTDAFDLDITEPTRLKCYVKIEWADGDFTLHPAAPDGSFDLWITPSFE